MTYAIPLWTPPALPVLGSDALFPVRRIWCVGRNYAAHAREMGSDPSKEPPCFFSKPADAILCTGDDIAYPPATRDLHHEVELVVALGQDAGNLSEDQAISTIYGYAVGIDLTRRDLQAAAKQAGQPWDLSKGFDGAAPCSAIRPATELTEPPHSGAIRLSVNGKLRQSGDLADLIWSVPQIIAYLSSFITLRSGDLIFTGTPEGVGPVRVGDHIDAGIDGIGALSVTIR